MIMKKMISSLRADLLEKVLSTVVTLSHVTIYQGVYWLMGKFYVLRQFTAMCTNCVREKGESGE